MSRHIARAVAEAAPIIPTEQAFQAQVKHLAQMLGWRVYHALYAIGSDRGYPDLTLVHPTQGRVIWAELKVRGKVSPAQINWQADLQAAGQEAYVWRWTPAIIDEIAEILRRRS